MSLTRLVTLGFALLACSACGSSATFRWRETTFETPEQALALQRSELKRQLEEIAPALEEERFEGSCTVVIPTQNGLRSSWFNGQAADPEGRQYYAIMKVRNECRFRQKALATARLFRSVKLLESKTPAAEAPRSNFVLIASPRPNSRELVWGLRSKKGTVTIKEDIHSLAEDRLEAFVFKVAEEGRGELTTSRLPVGWTTFSLPPGEAAGVRVGFPVVPKNPAAEDRELWRSWDIHGEVPGLELYILASQAKPGNNFIKDVLGGARDRLREQNKSVVLLDQDRSTKLGEEKWVLMRREDNGNLLLLRIVQTDQWLVTVGAAGAVIAERYENRTVETLPKLWGACAPTLRAFLESLEIPGANRK